MMKAIKKAISVILVVVIMLTAAPLSGLVGIELPKWLDFSIVSSAAETSGTCGENLTWTFDESTGTLTISGTGAMNNYDYDNRPWESYEDNIKKVIINNSVTTIGAYAFYDCDSLTSVTIGNSVTTIGDFAFSQCRNLTSVIIPNRVTSIGYSAFSSCDSLTSITIGDSVTSIDDGAFYSCRSLTRINIPDSVTLIGNDVFGWCDSLTSIIVDTNNEYYSNDEYGVLFNKDKTTLIQYPIGNIRTSYTIPDSVTSIGVGSFKGCHSLTSIIISDNVTSIGHSAFYGCTNLTSVTIGNSVTIIGNSAFSDCFSLTSVTIGDGVTRIGEYAFTECYGLTSITVDSNNQYYSNDEDGVLFNKDKTILIQYPIGNIRTSYTIPDSVTSIGVGSFKGCHSLTSIIISDNVTSIGHSAFYGCTNLTSVTIPNSVTTIGDHAFARCTNLTSVTIPDSVTTIGYDVFFGCDSLTNITVDSNNQYYSNDEYGVLFNKDKTTLIQYPIGNIRTSYTIPDSVTSISNSAFTVSYSLTSIIISDNVISIGDNAFSDCNNLTSVTIGNSVTIIGNSAFGNCPSLTDIYFNGTEDQWKAISVGTRNDDLLNATIHFNMVNCEEHDWSDWKVTKVPTYSEDGEEERFCKTCGQVEIRQIPKLMYSSNGDVNGDGQVTMVDVRILLLHITGKRALQDLEVTHADANGDGNITIVDVRAIAQLISGNKSDFDTTPGGTPTKAPNIALIANSEIVKEGDIITVAVTLLENPGIGIMHAELIYDTTTFKVNNVKMNYPSTLNLSDYFISDGKIIYAGVNSWDLYDTGVLFTVELVALQTVDSEITFNIVDAYDNDYDKIETSSQKLKISRERDATFCGENLTWTFDETTGTLTISGTGDMYDFGSINTPWYEFNDQIKSVVINEGATSVGTWAFNYCDNLVNVSLPDSLTEIGAHSFEGCYDLAKIKIPDSVTTIGAEAFSWCSSLKSVLISENVSSIGDRAFAHCGKLETITVDKDNEYYTSEDGVLFNKDKTVLIQYPSGNKRETYSIPDSVLTVESYAFSSCKYLKTLEIPHSVTKLEGSALYSCDSLEYIWVDEKNENYSSDDNGVLFNKDKTLLIQYPIGNPRMNYTIPDTVVTVAGYAFYNANNLTDVVIADSVVEIKASAFEECDRLEKVVIPKGVTTIGYEAFASCYNVASVSISASVETIDDRAFYNCRSLEKIIVDENNQNYSSNDDGVLFNKDKSVLIQYPIGNTRKSYTIPESVTRIQNDAFIFSDYLVDVTIPEGVTSIGYDAFAYCHSIERFIVDKNNKHYSNDEFGALFDKNKTTLIQYPIGNSRTEYKIPESVTMVNTFALSGSDHLTTLYISKNLSVVRPFAMTSMYYLRDVYYSGTEEDWKQISIDYTNYSLLNANIHFGYCEHLDMDNDGYCDNCDLQLCDHNCHKGGITGFFWMITNFFNKLFGLKQYCDCGVAHY